MLYLSRTALENYQTCPRLYWLTNKFLGHGVVPDKTGSDLILGLSRHKGVESLLTGASVDEAVERSIACYDADTVSGVSDAGPKDHDMPREHRAIIEAGLRVWAAVRLPQIKEKYEILSIETERSRQITPRTIFEGRPDGDFKLIEDGRIYAYSLKNPRTYGRSRHPECMIDMQGRSESWLLGETYGHDQVGGVLMDYIMTGVLKADGEFDTNAFNDDDVIFAPMIRWTPLIRGWYKDDADIGGRTFAWRQKWKNPEYDPNQPPNNYHNAKMKTFTKPHRIAAWEYAGGVKGWVEDLLAGDKFVPTHMSPVSEVIYSPDPYYRDPSQIAEWLYKTVEISENINDNLEALDKGTKNLQRAFPQYETSCVNKYGYKCRAWDLCHKGATADPLNNGFKKRDPHHKLEAESIL